MRFSSINPCDGSTVWTGNSCEPDELEERTSRARSVQAEWAARPLGARAEILTNFAEILKEKREDLATLIAREIGKPLWEARTEVASMIGKIDITIQAHSVRCGGFAGGKANTHFRPHGLLAVLGPYNFPGHLPNGHICPALLAGNTVLFKPSEHAPATAELTAACWELAGLPGGVLQVVQGGSETARALCAHPQLDGVLFTGSAKTGKLIARQFADTPGKVLALEMGGNNPLIVDSGYISDLDAAVRTTFQSAYITTGQRCTCARRLVLVDSPLADKFLEGLLRLARDVLIGDPFAHPAPFMGPLASIAFPEGILRAQKLLLDNGATTLLPATAPHPGTGFITPGLLDVTEAREVPDEEIFGPLLQVTRVHDLQSAIQAANNTRFGLATGILTDNDERFSLAYPRLRAGIINRNVPLTGASSAAPFGGIGDSGNLRPSAFLAADYCSYPVASISEDRCGPPPGLPGLG